MKKLLLLAGALLFSVGLTACGEVNTRISDEGALRIGMECDYAPFNWSTSTSSSYTLPIQNLNNLHADGYDVQIAQYLSTELNREVEIYAYEWDSLILELKYGNLDLIIAGMSPTDERKEQIDFTDAYYSTSHVVLMLATSDYKDATKLSDFSGANAVAQTGTVYDDLVDQLTGANHLTSLSSIPYVVTALISGAADISIVERPVAQALVAENPGLTFVALDEKFVLDEADAIVSIGLNKGNEDYVALINAALSKLSDGTRTAYMDAAVARQ